MKFSLVAAAGLLTLASCAPWTTYAVHEKRDVENRMWTPHDVKLDPRAALPLAISLTQQNLDNGYDFLMDVSDGKSPNYGKHWSQEKVRQTVNEFETC
jgi:tripeptidyl-peptidase-1